MIAFKSKTSFARSICNWCKATYFLQSCSCRFVERPSPGLSLPVGLLKGKFCSFDNPTRTFFSPCPSYQPDVCHLAAQFNKPPVTSRGSNQNNMKASQPLHVLKNSFCSYAKDIEHICSHQNNSKLLKDDSRPISELDSKGVDLNPRNIAESVGISKKLEYLYFNSSCTVETVKEVTACFDVVYDYLSKEEEMILINEVEPHLKRLQYEFDHWDDAIHGFREIERGRWGKSAFPIISRMKKYAFPDEKDMITQVHILDLAKTGVIKPHVDSVRFCGNIISGLCVLSDAVMRLVHVDNKDQVVDVMLPRRALYIMRDKVRYNYTHEVLGEKESFFGSVEVPRNRRISIMCRNNPKEGHE